MPTAALALGSASPNPSGMFPSASALSCPIITSDYSKLSSPSGSPYRSLFTWNLLGDFNGEVLGELDGEQMSAISPHSGHLACRTCSAASGASDGVREPDPPPTTTAWEGGRPPSQKVTG